MTGTRTSAPMRPAAVATLPLIDRDRCSAARTLEIVGERWTLLVLREVFYGVRRFESILEAVGCARNLLTDRLETLMEHELLARQPYREPGQRERYEYHLTLKGRELLPVLIALMQWGDKWHAARGGPPVVLRHAGCGAEVRVELRCAEGHGPVRGREIVPEFRKRGK